MKRAGTATFGMLAILAGGAASAHEISAQTDPNKPAAFDVTRAQATTDGRLATFIMEVTGTAGSQKPTPIGRLQGTLTFGRRSSTPARSDSNRGRASWR